MSLDRAADTAAADSSLCLRYGGRRTSCSVMMSADQLAQGDVVERQPTHISEDPTARHDELRVDTATTTDDVEESQRPSLIAGKIHSVNNRHPFMGDH